MKTWPRVLGAWVISWTIVLSLFAPSDALFAAEWKPADGPLMTRWAKEVSPECVHADYPRPQFTRPDWQNLNGLWQVAIRTKDAPAPTDFAPTDFDGQILVPFPAESALSGLMKPVGEANRLWYGRTFEVPEAWAGKRLLLHFEGVDWETTVWINGQQVGTHRGGYDPFTFDVTKLLKPKGPQQLTLAVWDPVDAGTQPRGKQVRQPKGIWYTSVTGIWRTVWLEPVPMASLAAVCVVPDIDAGTTRLEVATSGAQPGDVVQAIARDGDKRVAEAEAPVGRPLVLKLDNAKLWSPDRPFLYDLELTLLRDNRPIDTVASYFGMRKISLAKDEKGILRMMLNNEFVFQYGPLDQGWWPDGLYTAPTDEALRYDLEVLKKLGCNMLRKHVKVEPRRFYHWCDKLGLLVWQDMPNGDRHVGRNGDDIQRTPDSAKQFELELKRLIDTLRNHPAIIMWVPFNEGWGQYDTARIADWVKTYDPSRLVNEASGWADRGSGDIKDIHRYPGPATTEPEPNRAIVLGEFGGLGLPLSGHLWKGEGSWGYRGFKTRAELNRAYLGLLQNLHPMVGQGLSAAIYTQTSDCEIEVNGLMSYDRAVLKFDVEPLVAAHRRLSLPPPEIKTLVPTSQAEPHTWRYTTTQPPEGWEMPDFDDSTWRQGPAGFGTKDTPGAIVRTEWNTPAIWIRRTVDLPRSNFGRLNLRIHHDEEARVYLNGRLVAETTGFTRDYVFTPLANPGQSPLKKGQNTIAAHCRQTRGGQYLDLGIVEIIDP